MTDGIRSVRQQVSDRTGEDERIDGMGHGGLRPGPIGEPSVVRPAGEYDKRRAMLDFVLQLLRDTHPACRCGLAVEDREVDCASVEIVHHHGLAGDFDVLECRQRGVGVRADRSCHRGTRVGVAAVDEDAQRVGHACDATSEFWARQSFRPTEPSQFGWAEVVASVWVGDV